MWAYFKLFVLNDRMSKISNLCEIYDLVQDEPPTNSNSTLFSTFPGSGHLKVLSTLKIK